MPVITIGDRMKSAFGFATQNQTSSLANDRYVEYNGISKLGVYVNDATFEEITIRQSNEKALKFANMMWGDGNGSIYAPPPMISFKRGKNLIITEIDGTDSEVIERYGDKSWSITIRGILIDMNNHTYPKKKVIELNEYFEVQAPFIVEGEMFDDLKIRSIYFTDVDISGVAGYQDTIQYTLDARSIKPAQFFLTPQRN